jgi:hypothetical protein
MLPVVLVPERVLIDLLAHAASAAHLVGHLDAHPGASVADHLDAIVHEISELLGSSGGIAICASPCALDVLRRDDLALEVVPALVAEFGDV